MSEHPPDGADAGSAWSIDALDSMVGPINGAMRPSQPWDSIV
jgi:hypothetical protein